MTEEEKKTLKNAVKVLEGLYQKLSQQDKAGWAFYYNSTEVDESDIADMVDMLQAITDGKLLK